MEGATSTLHSLNNGWVRKTLKRKQKKKTTPAEKQLELQQWSAATLTPAHGFRILFTPRARSSTTNNSYEMERINTRDYIEKVDDPVLEAELEQFFRQAKAAGIYPSDFELYRQADGRIALLDFDKFGKISGKNAVFPYRGVVPLNTVPEESLYTESLAKRIQGIMKGGQRKTRRFRRTAAQIPFHQVAFP